MTPMAPRTTASEVNPSMRACTPSATRAAEPIRPADPDAVDGHGLVAGEADQAGDQHPPEVVQRLRVEQPVDRLPGGNDRRQRDDGDDEQPGQVFGAAVAVGVAPGGRPAAEHERDPERDRGQGVGEVVDGVGEQRDRTADEHDDQLQGGGAEQDEQADFHRPDALCAGLQGIVDRVGGVVAVRHEEAVEEALDPAGGEPCRRPWSWSWSWSWS